MSKETVAEILAKAITSKDYRGMLFNNPDAALDGYDLTEEEVNALKQLVQLLIWLSLNSRVVCSTLDKIQLRSMPSSIQCNALSGSFVEALD